MTRNASPATIAAKADDYLDTHTGAITPPIYTSTTYARDDRYRPLDESNIYARDDNPTFIQAERVLATLEEGDSALLFASGMAAIASIFYALRSGSNVVLPQSMYWGVYSWTANYCERADISISYYPTGDLDSIERALKSARRTELIWIETPANPMMHITDIEATAKLAREYGALLAVDNTLPTPVHTRPLTLGADLVVHSATKFLNGHSDILAGAIVTRDTHPLWEQIVAERHGAGAIISPFDAWLLLRGMRTLFLRVERASQSCASIAAFLENHDAVESVLYPGLASHPGHDIACSQMKNGFGGLLSFQVKGDKNTALAVAGRLQLILSATSLGGTETLIEHRYSVEPPETAVPENLLRLAVGIEDVDDLIEDLDQALRG